MKALKKWEQIYECLVCKSQHVSTRVETYSMIFLMIKMGYKKKYQHLRNWMLEYKS